MTPVSTRHLEALLDVDRLKALLQSLAVLDAIMSPEWSDRCYSFDSRWSRDEQMGSMRDGSGDGFFALFNRFGCLVKGFAHECPMSPYRSEPPVVWSGMLDGVPAEFSSAVSEPAFSMHDITFCIWRRYADESWSHGSIEFANGDDPDGSEALLAMLDGDPQRYLRFAEEYWEETVSIDAVQHVYEHRPLMDDVVSSVKADVTVESVAHDLVEIAYPNRTS